ncbi:putative ABC transport system permease protein [Corynebacterium spheniscorum]|uniref:Putative ABC transport system permease protein n=1 Tax=Corynebacterium spheniscorum TaxID=185761 RepID=A0A1I2Q7K7_9CORY|nr:ABC transporter permease [Corynebacterium spheniscorum]KAA8719600.1 ABC transporter permease [Corynebacterium spheniscorum]SFG24465.1 putative ABC transport system permease protein [Corynebacterium spheniscorum]
MSSGSTMRKVSARNVAAHKLRLALTVLAVVLGTAFISGAFMFTASLQNTFQEAVSTQYDGVDAVVTADTQKGSTTINPEMQQELRDNPKVAALNVSASTNVVLGNDKGEAIQTGSASSRLTPWYGGDDAVTGDKHVVEGKTPKGADEVVVNKKAATNLGLSVGQKLTVVDPKERHERTISGIYEIKGVDKGDVLLAMDEQAYVDEYTINGNLPGVTIRAAEGTSSDELVEALQEKYPTYEISTGQALAEKISEELSKALSFVKYFLVAFGLIALLVGSFIIANTFAMIVAQRTREFALLRALGASRSQITRSVMLEAIIVGIIGSAVGVLAGMGLVKVIHLVMEHKEYLEPGASLGLTPQSVLVPMALGLVVTLFSAWLPARRAGVIEPVEAMRQSEQTAAGSLKGRTIAGTVVLLIGVACAALAVVQKEWETDPRSILVGVATVAVIFGFFLAGPAFSLPIVPTIGRILGLPFGAVGKLAATNSYRNPRRTAATAFALTLGVALVAAFSVLGASMKASMADLVDDSLRADYVLSGTSSGEFPLPTEAAEKVKDVEGVANTTELYYAPVYVANMGSTSAEADGKGFSIIVDGDLSNYAEVPLIDGRMPDADHPGFLASEKLAKEMDWKVGEKYPLTSALVREPTHEVELLGTYEASASLFGKLVISKNAVSDVVNENILAINSVGVNAKSDTDKEKLRQDLEETTKSYLVVQVKDAKQILDESTQIVTKLLGILYGLLALAVIIAVLGIVNTLTLNVIERRQEIGMLRAVGTHRKQIRRMITLEAVQIAIFGALMGVVIGVSLGWAFLRVLSGQGLDSFAIDYQTIIWMLIGSGVVGAIAAIWPAHRAAKTPPLDAIAD